MGNLYENISNSSAHKLSRDTNSADVLNRPELFQELFRFAVDITDPNHYKACWVMELVLEKKIDWLLPYMDQFCETLREYKHEGAMRSVSKICMFAAAEHIRKINSAEAFLSEGQLQKITEACFNWLISDVKVASKAYSIRALYEIGKAQKWVYAELQAILEKDYPTQSAGYKAVTKQILPRLK